MVSDRSEILFGDRLGMFGNGSEMIVDWLGMFGNRLGAFENGAC